eukprot:c33750_g1_i1.p1 GENE.c33750_g1_i1~~c33750_g1_i1.p1  ORF type:complete len:170 (-),score=44.58 c33750_g1_i1:24-533(-)
MILILFQLILIQLHVQLLLITFLLIYNYYKLQMILIFHENALIDYEQVELHKYVLIYHPKNKNKLKYKMSSTPQQQPQQSRPTVMGYAGKNPVISERHIAKRQKNFATLFVISACVAGAYGYTIYKMKADPLADPDALAKYEARKLQKAQEIENVAKESKEKLEQTRNP